MDIPLFITEFKTTFAYARGKQARYYGNRLAAGLIEHFGEINLISNTNG